MREETLHGLIQLSDGITSEIFTERDFGWEIQFGEKHSVVTGYRFDHQGTPIEVVEYWPASRRASKIHKPDMTEVQRLSLKLKSILNEQ